MVTEDFWFTSIHVVKKGV